MICRLWTQRRRTPAFDFCAIRQCIWNRFSIESSLFRPCTRFPARRGTLRLMRFGDKYRVGRHRANGHCKLCHPSWWRSLFRWLYHYSSYLDRRRHRDARTCRGRTLCHLTTVLNNWIHQTKSKYLCRVWNTPSIHLCISSQSCNYVLSTAALHSYSRASFYLG